MSNGIMGIAQEEEALATNASVAEATTFDGEAESVLIDVNDAAAEVDQTNESIDSAADASDTLAVIEGQVEAADAGDGMSEEMAAVVDVAVEHLKTSVGFPANRAKVVSLESFKDETSRKEATKIALEGIKDTAKRIWDAIVAGFKRAVAWVKEFFTGLFNSAKSLKMRADRIAGAASKAQGNAPADATISAKSFAKALSINGKVPEGDAMQQAYDASVKITDESLKTCGILVAELIDVVEEKAESVKAPRINPMDAPAKYTIPEGCILDGKPLQFGNNVAYLQIPESGELKGAESFMESAKAMVGLGKYKIFVMPSSEPKVGEDAKVKPLTNQQVAKLAKAVSAKMSDVLKAKDAYKMAENSAKTVSAMALKAARVDGADDKEIKKMKASQAASRSLMALCSSGVTALNKYDVNVAKHALDYCGSSLKASDVKPKEEKKEDK